MSIVEVVSINMNQYQAMVQQRQVVQSQLAEAASMNKNLKQQVVMLKDALALASTQGIVPSMGRYVGGIPQ